MEIGFQLRAADKDVEGSATANHLVGEDDCHHSKKVGVPTGHFVATESEFLSEICYLIRKLK